MEDAAHSRRMVHAGLYTIVDDSILSEFAVFMLLFTRTNSLRVVQPLQLTPEQRALLHRRGLSTPAQLLSHRLPRPPR